MTGKWAVYEIDGTYEVYDNVFEPPAFYAETWEEAVAICERHGKVAEYGGELAIRD